jgi:hypothetical protein
MWREGDYTLNCDFLLDMIYDTHTYLKETYKVHFRLGDGPLSPPHLLFLKHDIFHGFQNMFYPSKFIALLFHDFCMVLFFHPLRFVLASLV